MGIGGALFTEIERSRGVTDLGTKTLKEKYLSLSSFYYSSIKDSKKLDLRIWGFKREIQARDIPIGYP